MLREKHIVLGVSGGIAAYKIASLASMLKKQSADITVIMTRNATNFINPITFEALTGNKCLVDTFDRNFKHSVEHVSLAKQTDVFLVAPASANVIAKAAHGLADDMLTTTLLACECPKLVAPAMNTRMYRNPVLQDNLKLLAHYGMQVITPATGYLACGDTGEGKMPDPEVLFEAILRALRPKDMAGLKVLVTAGPTREKIDPVRYLSNHSTGKMGYAIARAAISRGAEVTLVTGKTDLTPPGEADTVEIVSAADMARAVKERARDQDIIIKAAAVADYRPKQVNAQKTKKQDGTLVIELERTRDILAELGAKKGARQCLCGFSMETEHVLAHSREKRKRKNADLIAANSIREAGAGFGVDTNHLVLITQEGEEDLGMLPKEACAERLLDRLYGIWKTKQEGQEGIYEENKSNQ